MLLVSLLCLSFSLSYQVADHCVSDRSDDCWSAQVSNVQDYVLLQKGTKPSVVIKAVDTSVSKDLGEIQETNPNAFSSPREMLKDAMYDQSQEATPMKTPVTPGTSGTAPKQRPNHIPKEAVSHIHRSTQETPRQNHIVEGSWHDLSKLAAPQKRAKAFSGVEAAGISNFDDLGQTWKAQGHRANAVQEILKDLLNSGSQHSTRTDHAGSQNIPKIGTRQVPGHIFTEVASHRNHSLMHPSQRAHHIVNDRSRDKSKVAAHQRSSKKPGFSTALDMSRSGDFGKVQETNSNAAPLVQGILDDQMHGRGQPVDGFHPSPDHIFEEVASHMTHSQWEQHQGKQHMAKAKGKEHDRGSVAAHTNYSLLQQDVRAALEQVSIRLKAWQRQGAWLAQSVIGEGEVSLAKSFDTISSFTLLALGSLSVGMLVCLCHCLRRSANRPRTQQEILSEIYAEASARKKRGGCSSSASLITDAEFLKTPVEVY